MNIKEMVLEELGDFGLVEDETPKPLFTPPNPAKAAQNMVKGAMKAAKASQESAGSTAGPEQDLATHDKRWHKQGYQGGPCSVRQKWKDKGFDVAKYDLATSGFKTPENYSYEGEEKEGPEEETEEKEEKVEEEQIEKKEEKPEGGESGGEPEEQPKTEPEEVQIGDATVKVDSEEGKKAAEALAQIAADPNNPELAEKAQEAAKTAEEEQLALTDKIPEGEITDEQYAEIKEKFPDNIAEFKETIKQMVVEAANEGRAIDPSSWGENTAEGRAFKEVVAELKEQGAKVSEEASKPPPAEPKAEKTEQAEEPPPGHEEGESATEAPKAETQKPGTWKNQKWTPEQLDILRKSAEKWGADMRALKKEGAFADALSNILGKVQHFDQVKKDFESTNDTASESRRSFRENNVSKILDKDEKKSWRNLTADQIGALLEDENVPVSVKASLEHIKMKLDNPYESGKSVEKALDDYRKLCDRYDLLGEERSKTGGTVEGYLEDGNENHRKGGVVVSDGKFKDWKMDIDSLPDQAEGNGKVKNPDQIKDKMANDLKQRGFPITPENIKETNYISTTDFSYKFPSDMQVSKNTIASLKQEIARNFPAAEDKAISIRYNDRTDTITVTVENDERGNISQKKLLQSPEFQDALKRGELAVAIGVDDKGKPIIGNLTDYIHVLLAGTTGSGKSARLGSIISSLMMQSPDNFRMILVDPKKVEFSRFKDDPHLLSNIITEGKDAVEKLNYLVNEQENRYRLFAKAGVSDLKEYNEKGAKGMLPEGLPKHLPSIGLFIDEFGNLMGTHGKDIEALVKQLGEKSRAAGVHLVLATQRPTAKNIPTDIRTNLPTTIGLNTRDWREAGYVGISGLEDLPQKGPLIISTPDGKEIKGDGSFIKGDNITSMVQIGKDAAKAISPDGSAKPAEWAPDGSTTPTGGEGETVAKTPEQQAWLNKMTANLKGGTSYDYADGGKGLDMIKRELTRLGIPFDEKPLGNGQTRISIKKESTGAEGGGEGATAGGTAEGAPAEGAAGAGEAAQSGSGNNGLSAIAEGYTATHGSDEAVKDDIFIRNADGAIVGIISPDGNRFDAVAGKTLKPGERAPWEAETQASGRQNGTSGGTSQGGTTAGESAAQSSGSAGITTIGGLKTADLSGAGLKSNFPVQKDLGNGTMELPLLQHFAGLGYDTYAQPDGLNLAFSDRKRNQDYQDLNALSSALAKATGVDYNFLDDKPRTARINLGNGKTAIGCVVGTPHGFDQAGRRCAMTRIVFVDEATANKYGDQIAKHLAEMPIGAKYTDPVHYKNSTQFTPSATDEGAAGAGEAAKTGSGETARPEAATASGEATAATGETAQTGAGEPTQTGTAGTGASETGAAETAGASAGAGEGAEENEPQEELSEYEKWEQSFPDTKDGQMAKIDAIEKAAKQELESKFAQKGIPPALFSRQKEWRDLVADMNDQRAEVEARFEEKPETQEETPAEPAEGESAGTQEKSAAAPAPESVAKLPDSFTEGLSRGDKDYVTEAFEDYQDAMDRITEGRKKGAKKRLTAEDARKQRQAALDTFNKALKSVGKGAYDPYAEEQSPASTAETPAPEAKQPETAKAETTATGAQPAETEEAATPAEGAEVAQTAAPAPTTAPQNEVAAPETPAPTAEVATPEKTPAPKDKTPAAKEPEPAKVESTTPKATKKTKPAEATAQGVKPQTTTKKGSTKKETSSQGGVEQMELFAEQKGKSEKKPAMPKAKEPETPVQETPPESPTKTPLKDKEDTKEAPAKQEPPAESPKTAVSESEMALREEAQKDPALKELEQKTREAFQSKGSDSKEFKDARAEYMKAFEKFKADRMQKKESESSETKASEPKAKPTETKAEKTEASAEAPKTETMTPIEKAMKEDKGIQSLEKRLSNAVSKHGEDSAQAKKARQSLDRAKENFESAFEKSQREDAGVESESKTKEEKPKQETKKEPAKKEEENPQAKKEPEAKAEKPAEEPKGQKPTETEKKKEVEPQAEKVVEEKGEEPKKEATAETKSEETKTAEKAEEPAESAEETSEKLSKEGNETNFLDKLDAFEPFWSGQKSVSFKTGSKQDKWLKSYLDQIGDPFTETKNKDGTTTYSMPKDYGSSMAAEVAASSKAAKLPLDEIANIAKGNEDLASALKDYKSAAKKYGDSDDRTKSARETLKMEYDIAKASGAQGAPKKRGRPSKGPEPLPELKVDKVPTIKFEELYKQEGEGDDAIETRIQEGDLSSKVTDKIRQVESLMQSAAKKAFPGQKLKDVPQEDRIKFMRKFYADNNLGNLLTWLDAGQRERDAQREAQNKGKEPEKPAKSEEKTTPKSEKPAEKTPVQKEEQKQEKKEEPKDTTPAKTEPQKKEEGSSTAEEYLKRKAEREAAEAAKKEAEAKARRERMAKVEAERKGGGGSRELNVGAPTSKGETKVEASKTEKSDKEETSPAYMTAFKGLVKPKEVNEESAQDLNKKLETINNELAKAVKTYYYGDEKGAIKAAREKISAIYGEFDRLLKERRLGAGNFRFQEMKDSGGHRTGLKITEYKDADGTYKKAKYGTPQKKSNSKGGSAQDEMPYVEDGVWYDISEDKYDSFGSTFTDEEWDELEDDFVRIASGEE